MECTSVRHSSLCLATLLLVFRCSEAFLWEDNTFTEVLSECPATSTGSVLVTINTDASETYPYAICYDEYVYDFIEVHTGSWKLEVVFNSDIPDQECIFKKQQNSEIYYLKVYVPIATDIFFGDEFAHLVNCSYETKPKEPIDSSLKDSKKPVEQRMTNFGVLSDTDIKVSVVDYAGDEITEKLRVGRFIKLHAELLGNTSGVESFQAVSCEVFSPPDLYYNIIIGGCGDGTIVDRNAGFQTTGREAYSPLFRVFQVARTTTLLTFNCTFIICNDTCDGSSCEVTSRKRRDSETVNDLGGHYLHASLVAEVDSEFETKPNGSDVIVTSVKQASPRPPAVEIEYNESDVTTSNIEQARKHVTSPRPPAVEIELNGSYVTTSNVEHAMKRVTSPRPPAVEIEYLDSVTMKDLQISLVVMVVVPVVCTLAAMLMTVYLLWVTLSNVYCYSQAKGRGKLASMKDATEI